MCFQVSMRLGSWLLKPVLKKSLDTFLQQPSLLNHRQIWARSH